MNTTLSPELSEIDARTAGVWDLMRSLAPHPLEAENKALKLKVASLEAELAPLREAEVLRQQRKAEKKRYELDMYAEDALSNWEISVATCGCEEDYGKMPEGYERPAIDRNHPLFPEYWNKIRRMSREEFDRIDDEYQARVAAGTVVPDLFWPEGSAGNPYEY